MKYPLIMLAKIAYSNWYNGSRDLRGQHSYVKAHGDGCERFNFASCRPGYNPGRKITCI
jgi:hypothetical protein